MNNQPVIQDSFYACLSAIFAFLTAAAAILGYLIVGNNTFFVSAATIVFSINFALCDLITEIYGYTTAKKTIFFMLFLELMFALVLKLIMLLPNPDFFYTKEAYLLVINPILRFVISGILAVLSGLLINSLIMSKLKVLMRGKHFWLRSFVSSAISKIVMSIVIVTFAFSGVFDVLSILLNGYFYHLIFTAIMIWPTWLAAIIIKNVKKCDVYDTNISYNPFKWA